MPTASRSRSKSRGRRRDVASTEAPSARTPEPTHTADGAAAPEHRWASQRAVFFDVENSSRADHLATILEHLGLKAIDRDVQIMAVGNWRVVGHESAALLAQHGAALIHSAPAFGVKDWTDLRIAVAAGVWLSGARPADVLEIVSDDQAFDAVGDVAASLGVTFHRVSYRSLAGEGLVPRVAPSRPRRRGGAQARRSTRSPERMPGRGGSHVHSRTREVVETASAVPLAASEAEIVTVVRTLIAAAPSATVSLDALSNALKAHGFQRPPGSLRLVTRLRKIRELHVSPRGIIRLTAQHPTDVTREGTAP